MLMKQWTASFIKRSFVGNSHVRFIGRVAYYYLILMGLFYLYMVQKQHTPAPYIYNNF